MTSGAPALPWPRSRGRIRFSGSSFVEFLLVGGATLFLLPLAIWSEGFFGLDASELAVGFLAFHAATVLNDPHFSVTYLLFYRDAKNRAFGTAFDPAQRRRYVVAGILVPLVLAIWIAIALSCQSARTMGLLLQLMFLLVGWHYVKQGFGVLTVLSARRHVRFSPNERKAILFHAYAGWAYAWASPADPGTEVVEKGVVHLSLARPPWLEVSTEALFFASSAVLFTALVSRWKREAKMAPLGPLVGFLVTVWLWTVYSSLNPLLVYVIPALHSVQYLYFVWLMKRNAARAEEGPPAFGKPARQRLAILAISAVALGWLLFRGLPPVLDDTLVLNDPDGFTALGSTPYLAGIFAFVNIHHYFMDAVLWRRENPESKFLLATRR